MDKIKIFKEYLIKNEELEKKVNNFIENVQVQGITHQLDGFVGANSHYAVVTIIVWYKE